MDRSVRLIYRVPRRGSGWELSDDKWPESTLHDACSTLLKEILTAWAKRRENVMIARNFAVRWDEEEPSIGVDPDVCVLSPAPPLAPNGDLDAVRTWLPGHAAPLLAIEIVNTAEPHKDYSVVVDKYAASGTRELVVFDPSLEGPTTHGGPFPLQVWRRDERGDFVRVHAGDAPAYSEVLSAHLVTVEDGRMLRVADDAAGARLWPTEIEAIDAETARLRAETARIRAETEAIRARTEVNRAEMKAERTDLAAALARIAELEAQLRRR